MRFESLFLESAWTVTYTEQSNWVISNPLYLDALTSIAGDEVTSWIFLVPKDEFWDSKK
jgi:hypothetical protein